jgi:transposase
VSAGDPFVRYPNEGTVWMIVLGADTHKLSHTLAAVDAATGRLQADRTVRAKRRSFEDVLQWARSLDAERVWAIEDCRHVSGALERFLLARGERVVRVAPKLMAGARRSSRERGKSDAIDAVAIARAAIREGLETLPAAQLAGPELDVRLLVDHRERLVAQRTALINDLRWGLHDLWPEFEIPPRALTGARWQERVASRLARAEQTARVRVARDELRRGGELGRAIDALERELAPLVAELAPRLLAERGCGVLTAAKLIGEVAGVERFASDAKLARTAGSAPIPAASGRTDRHRLDRGGNRQLNCALHRLAVSKARRDPETARYLARKQAEGKSRREALRCLKRHLARRVYKLLQPPTAPLPPTSPTPLGERPPVIARAGRMIHCNTPAGTPALT